MCRRMLGKVLQSLSITFEEAEDGVQAIEKVQRSLQLQLIPRRPGEESNIQDKSSERTFDLILVSPSVCCYSYVLSCPVRML